MIAQDAEKFARLCAIEANAPDASASGGIGTYSEKRLHRILKRFITEDESCFEKSVGPYVADVLMGDQVFEIQTASLRPLYKKIKYYLECTDLCVTVIHPTIAENTIIRMDKDTGEVLRRRRSTARGEPHDALSELYWLRELIPNERLCVKIFLVNAEEYRYSERMRYRRQGAFDSELYPTELCDVIELHNAEDFIRFLPSDKKSFTATEYASIVKRKGRRVYSALNFLCAIDLLERHSEGKRYIYAKKQ